jgi:hypothetical protein
MYWVVTGLIIALALFSADRATRLAPNYVAASILLIPHGQELLLGVAWTLEHESCLRLVWDRDFAKAAHPPPRCVPICAGRGRAKFSPPTASWGGSEISTIWIF